MQQTSCKAKPVPMVAGHMKLQSFRKSSFLVCFFARTYHSGRSIASLHKHPCGFPGAQVRGLLLFCPQCTSQGRTTPKSQRHVAVQTVCFKHCIWQLHFARRTQRWQSMQHLVPLFATALKKSCIVSLHAVPEATWSSQGSTAMQSIYNRINTEWTLCLLLLQHQQ